MRQKDINDHIKTIIKCNDVTTINCLDGIDGFKDGKHNKDTNGKIVNGPNNIAVIHHYFTKTRQEFNIKKNILYS